MHIIAAQTAVRPALLGVDEVLEPFPAKSFRAALSGVETVINVEANATGQFARLLACQGLPVDHKLLRFDARPFTTDRLVEKIKEVMS